MRKTATLAVLTALGALGAPAAFSAQQPATDYAAPVFIPWTGENLGDELPSRITVQNLHSAPLAYLVVHFPTAGEPACPDCRAFVVQSSPVIAPGATWSVDEWEAGADGGSAVVFGMPQATMEAWYEAFGVEDHAAKCAVYRDLLTQVRAGAMHDATAVTNRVPRRAGLGAPATDLMGGIANADAGAPGAGAYAYAATGAHIQTYEGFNSTIAIQNAGAQCATASLSLFLTGEGAQGQMVEVSIPPGEARLFLPSGSWPFRDTGAVLVESDQPLAVAVSTVGYDTAAAHGASPVLPAETWWAPLAFQEERRAVEPEDLPGDWRGAQSVVNALNLTTSTVQIQVRTQAYGHAARDVGIPMPASEQIAFQLGFGLGLDGGPGWGRLTPETGTVVAALESYRTENMGPRVVEQYSSRLARRPSSPYLTFGIPDLGGPALGGGAHSTESITTALESRVSIQNMLGSPATVALEAVGECGPSGAVTHTIGADQALVLSARELPGVAGGANSALIRVLDGEVAALVDIVREQRIPQGADPPPDHTSGYLAPGLMTAFAGAQVPRATMTATTTALTLTPGSYEASVEVTFAADGARCLGFSAQPSEEWLAVNPNAGALPALITVHALPELFPRDGSEPLVADIVVHATGPDVAGSPLTIRVTVDLPDEGTVFIPVASKP